jgi:transposase
VRTGAALQIAIEACWSRKGVWQRIFAAISHDDDFEYLIIGSTIIRAYQHASGAKGGVAELSDKIMLNIKGMRARSDSI